VSLTVSSYIPTGNATGTRNRDQCSFPLTAIPQALTVYAKFRVGNAVTTTQLCVAQLGSTGTTNPRFILGIGSTANYVATLRNAAGTAVASGSMAAVTIGTMVEMRATISATGIVQLGVTLNSGTEALAAASAALALPQTWASQKFIVGSLGATNVNTAGYAALAIARGGLSLTRMRQIAGVLTRNG